MPEDLLDYLPFVDEVDDLHLGMAFRAFEKVDFPYLFDAFTPRE